jgi:hypothetical protein
MFMPWAATGFEVAISRLAITAGINLLKFIEGGCGFFMMEGRIRVAGESGSLQKRPNRQKFLRN